MTEKNTGVSVWQIILIIYAYSLFGRNSKNDAILLIQPIAISWAICFWRHYEEQGQVGLKCIQQQEKNEDEKEEEGSQLEGWGFWWEREVGK